MAVEVEVEEEEVGTGEDYCFVCKDGGELRVCDFRFARSRRAHNTLSFLGPSHALQLWR
jgi:hypothetical protein